MIQVLALLYAGPGGVEALQAYETAVMPILREHGATLLTAFRPARQTDARTPDEIHLLQFPSREALAAYRADVRIRALADRRENAIAATTAYVSEAFVRYEGA